MSTDALTNAIEALFTPAQTLTPSEAAVSAAEAQLATLFQNIAKTGLAEIPALDFPVEKQVIDAIVDVAINILVDKLDQLTFNIVTDIQEKRFAAQLETAAQAAAADKTGASDQALEDAADQIIKIGKGNI